MFPKELLYPDEEFELNDGVRYLLLLDEEFIQSIQNIQKKEEEKNKIQIELSEAENNLNSQQGLVNSLKVKLDKF